MPRRLAFIAICLALGAATTIALAFACAAWINPETAAPGQFTHAQLADDRWAMISTRSRFGHSRIDRIVGDVPVSENGDGSIHVEWPEGVATFDADDTFSRSTCGWPLRALWCIDTSEVTVHVPGESTPTGVELGRPRTVGGIPLRPWTTSGLWPSWRALPLRPLWKGLFIDTLFWASAWELLLLAAGRARQAVRRSRGLCPQCGYDLRCRKDASGPCPECGAARSASG